MDPVEVLERLFNAHYTVEEGWASLIEAVRPHYPAARWDLLDGIDLKREQRSFDAWLEDNLPAERNSIAAWYFGLAEEGAMAHLDGCGTFDAEDPSCDWACDYAWRSDDDWADSIGLARIVEISEEASEEVPVLLYTLALGYLGLFAAGAAGDLALPVAVGFDDGDAFVLPKRL